MRTTDSSTLMLGPALYNAALMRKINSLLERNGLYIREECESGMGLSNSRRFPRLQNHSCGITTETPWWPTASREPGCAILGPTGIIHRDEKPMNKWMPGQCAYRPGAENEAQKEMKQKDYLLEIITIVLHSTSAQIHTVYFAPQLSVYDHLLDLTGLSAHCRLTRGAR
jgi:hypothetical protein